MSDEPDDEKPPIPYVKGCRFTVQQHTPPPPPPLPPRGCTTTCAESDQLEKLDPVERCLQHPPLQGSYGPLTLDLCIRDTIRVGDKHNSQLVVVEVLTAGLAVDGLGPGDQVVAKVYDPLYADDDDLYINVFMGADQDYTREVTAYGVLSDLQGSTVPRYYGSYSLDVPVGAVKRCVRLILMELIPGSSMQHTDPRGLSQQTRQGMMKSVAEFDTMVYTRNMVLRDLHPRNIMLPPAAGAGNRAAIVFIDFGDTRFSRTIDGDPEREPGFFPDTYISPLLRWHEAVACRGPEFLDWIDWDWQAWLEAEFAHTAATITPAIHDRFYPILFIDLWRQRRQGHH